jgi:uncharacterized protein
MAVSPDLEELDRYLDSDLSPDDCLGLSGLDGFLTGIVIGPEQIMPGEWLPAVWGQEEPEFESLAHANKITGLIMARHAEIATGFNFDPEKFEPIFQQQPTGEAIVTGWAAGFLDAVELRRVAWRPLFSHRKAKLLIEPLLILGGDGEQDHERDAGDRWKEFYASRSDVIPICVIGIYNFWKDHQGRKSPRPRRDRKPRR